MSERLQAKLWRHARKRGMEPYTRSLLDRAGVRISALQAENARLRAELAKKENA